LRVSNVNDKGLYQQFRVNLDESFLMFNVRRQTVSLSWLS